MTTAVSVVVPSVGQAELRRAVTSVIASGALCGIDTQVIVVWQGPGEPDVPDGVDVIVTHPVSLAYARNRGTARATAPLVGFVDDDEVVDEGWVNALAEALADADAAFGPIDPLDDDGRPHCLTDHGEARIVASGTKPWLVGSGGCMAFRREALLALDGFDLRFGAGAVFLSGEETDLIWRLQTAGRRIRWAPAMITYHPSKTDAEILASRYPYGFGSGRVLRRSRSPRLVAGYLRAAARANVVALRDQDPVARQDASAFARGLVDGLLRRRTWMAPDLARQELPEAVKAALPAGPVASRPVVWAEHPHYSWTVGDAVLHAHIGVPAPAAPAGLRAEGRSRDAHWTLEEVPRCSASEPT